ncbi:MAG TPA: hypothetical protein VM680_08030 [Verrucomicrobiae bacterium]|nr:hypothetical protein [Verrucomicrobiae bacterium]
MIEDTEGASLTSIGLDDDDEKAPKLDAIMVTGDGEKERTLWRAKIPGSIYQFMDGDSLIVSPKGNFFVASPDHWNGEEIRIFSERGMKILEFPKTAEHELPMYDRLIEIDKIGSEDVVRIWESKADRWIAFKAASGEKVAVTAELTARWNEAMRRKILDLIARRAKEELRQRIEGAVPKIGRLTAMMVSDQPSQQVNDTHYTFLVARRQPEDRKIFEAMLNKQKRPEMQRHRGFFCGTGRTWRDSYRFSEGDYERERADAFLARWDKKSTEEKFFSTYLEKPYQLARLEGGVKLAAPILTNAGKVHIHLIPVGKEGTRWTNDAGAAYLECELPSAMAEQSDLIDEIEYSFTAIRPGKYFLKAVWDKRAPTNDVTAPGPGDYQSKLIGPLQLKAGDMVTNLIVNCTNRVQGAEGYYAADEAAVRSWKVKGELSPASFATRVPFSPFRMTADAPVEVFSRRADQWIVKTNQAPARDATTLARVSLGTTEVWPNRNRDREPNLVPALKFYFSETLGRRTFGQLNLKIVDEHGCEFESQSQMGWYESSAASFPRYPRTSKTFRLIATDGSTEKALWDLTLTNLVARNNMGSKGERLPVSKDFGPVNVTISRLRAEDYDLGLEYEVAENGRPASGWRLIERELVDSAGANVVEGGLCVEETSVTLLAVAVRDINAAPAKWNVKVPKLPDKSEFLPLDLKTNLCGLDVEVLGVAGTETTKFELPIRLSDRSMSVSGGDYELSVTSNRAKVRSKERMLVLMVSRKREQSDDVMVYLRGVTDPDGEIAGPDVELDNRTKLLFVPLASIEKNGAIELAFSADKKIPVEFTIEPPKDFKATDRGGRRHL